MWTREHLARYSGALYCRLSQLIEAYIEKGILLTGERLPSERRLAQLLGINRSTVVHALEWLEDRGIVLRRVGSGTFINDQKWHVFPSPLIQWRRPRFEPEVHTPYIEKQHRVKWHARTRGLPICDLSNGDLPAVCLPEISLPDISTAQWIVDEQSNYENISGLPALKIQIREYMKCQFALDVPIDQILITSGTQQSLFLISQGLLKPGDAIGIEIPSYFYSLPLFQAAGLRMVPIACDMEGIRLEVLDEMHQKYRLKFVFVNPVFQNPTGRVMSVQRKKDLLEYASVHRIGIVEDDACSAVYFSDTVDRQPLKKRDTLQQVIYLGSLSKYLGRHIRLGWLIAPAPVVQRLAGIRHSIDAGLSILPQLLAERYLVKEYLSHQHQLRCFFLYKRNLLHEWLSEQHPSSFTYLLPEGGFHLYVALTEEGGTETSFIMKWLLQNRLVRLGSDFGATKGYLRLSYGHFYKLK